MTNSLILSLRVFLVICVVASAPAIAQPLTPAEQAAIDSGVRAVLDSTGAPSASIAVVRGVVLEISMMVLPDGKIDQFIVSRAG